MKGIINAEVLVRFVEEMAYEVVGANVAGEQTTLSDELACIAKYIMRGDVCRIAYAPDPYRHSRLAYSVAELNEDEKYDRVTVCYHKAFRKILWLNSVCRNAGYGMFLTRKVNPRTQADVIEVAEAFEAAIRNAAVEKDDRLVV